MSILPPSDTAPARSAPTVPPHPGGRPSPWPRRLVALLLLLTGALTFGYAAISVYAARKIAVAGARIPITSTPANLGLAYRNITFPAREDGVMLKGWFIPGVLPDGRLTTNRTLIVVHGNDGNRADKSINLLGLTGDLARRGFAVLAFDLRGYGESPPAPLSQGYFEDRDVLGAVDFLRSGTPPYPELGRPRIIAGWGLSMGAVSLVEAAMRERAIAAIVADSMETAIAPIVAREVTVRKGGLPLPFVPGAFVTYWVLYGVNFYAIRPVDLVARLAPRPLFFIQAEHDDFTPPSSLGILTRAAQTAPHAHVRSWQVPGVRQHAQEYNVVGAAYIDRVVAFYNAALGPDTSPTSG
jgi:fermentation-respiration switch protein FrsA (DUF1100 family)